MEARGQGVNWTPPTFKYLPRSMQLTVTTGVTCKHMNKAKQMQQWHWQTDRHDYDRQVRYEIWWQRELQCFELSQLSLNVIIRYYSSSSSFVTDGTTAGCGCLCQLHTHTHTRIHTQVFIRLRGSRTHLATSHNLTTPVSYTNFTSQPHKY